MVGRRFTLSIIMLFSVLSALSLMGATCAREDDGAGGFEQEQLQDSDAEYEEP